MMKRAFAVFNVKSTSIANGKRTIRGIATTPETDSYGDIVESEGAEFELPMPVLWQHDSSDPVGWVRAAKPNKNGIPVELEIADIAEPGPLKDRLDMVWQYVTNKLVRGLSIGFQSIESARIEGTYGYRFLKWKWLELSLVTIPANQAATITAVKSADAAMRTPSGRRTVNVNHLAPSGIQRSAPSGAGDGTTGMKTLVQLLEERGTKSARATELDELRKKQDGERFTEEQRSEFAALQADLDALEDEILIARFNERKAANAQRVRSDDHGQNQNRGPAYLPKRDKEDEFKGQSFIKMVKMKALARIQQVSAAYLAQKYYGETHPQFVQFMRAAVAGGGTGSGEWSAELVKLDALYTGDFIEFLYSQTVFDRLPLRPVPARVRVKGQDGQATGYWVGESKAIPATAMDFSSIDLTPLKVAALAVISNEDIEDSAPAADMIVRDGLAEASAQKVDSTFFSTAAASAGVSPAGMLNGVTPIQASGTDEAAVRTDSQAVAYPFVTAKMSSGLIWVMNPAQGLSLGSFVNTFSQPSFPGVNENGGQFMGRQVFTGDNVPTGSIILLRPRDIWKIGDGGVQVSMSDVATIEMNDAPAGASDTPVAMASHTVSMFQTESTAFKVVRRINFQKRRTGAVQYIDNAEYGGVTS